MPSSSPEPFPGPGSEPTPRPRSLPTGWRRPRPGGRADRLAATAGWERLQPDERPDPPDPPATSGRRSQRGARAEHRAARAARAPLDRATEDGDRLGPAPARGLRSRQGLPIVVSFVIHAVVLGALAVRIASEPPPESSAVLHVRLEVPEPPELELAPVEIEGLREPLAEEGETPVETDDPAEALETANEERLEQRARGTAEGTTLGAGDPSIVPSFHGIGGGGAPSYGWEAGAGLVESALTPGGRQGLARLRSEGLDLVLAFDITGSMEDNFERDRANAQATLELISVMVPESRFGLIFFTTKLERVIPLTFDRSRVTEAIEKVSPTGGGDECVEAVLERAVSAEMGWRANTQRVVILIGDEAADASDQPRCVAAVRGARASYERLVVHTVSAESSLVPTFGEIAAAGGGDAVISGRTEALHREILRMAFGRGVGDEVEAWLRDNPDLARRHFGLGLEELYRVARDARRPAEQRLDAALGLMRVRGGPLAVALLLDAVRDDPSALAADASWARLWEALGAPAPALPEALDGDAAAAWRHRCALTALARLAGERRARPAAATLLAMAEDEADPALQRAAAWALARAIGPDRADALERLVARAPDLLDPASLIEAIAASRSAPLAALALARLRGEPPFADPALFAVPPPLRTAVEAVVAGRPLDARGIGAFRDAAPPSDPGPRALVGLCAASSLCTDGGRLGEMDPRLAWLAALDADSLAASVRLVAGADGEAAPARVALELAPHLEPARLRRLIAQADIPLSTIAREATRGTTERTRRPARLRPILGIVSDGLATGPTDEVAYLTEQARALPPPIAADLAVHLQRPIASTAGARRRHLLGLFCELTDARGIPLLVDAIEWEQGRHTRRALEALRRITGEPIAEPDDPEERADLVRDLRERYDPAASALANR